MKTIRNGLACAVLLAVVSACSGAVEKRLEAPNPLPLCTKKGGDETDGGVGGTGKAPIDCRNELNFQ